MKLYVFHVFVAYQSTIYVQTIHDNWFSLGDSSGLSASNRMVFDNEAISILHTISMVVEHSRLDLSVHIIQVAYRPSLHCFPPRKINLERL